MTNHPSRSQAFSDHLSIMISPVVDGAFCNGHRRSTGVVVTLRYSNTAVFHYDGREMPASGSLTIADDEGRPLQIQVAMPTHSDPVAINNRGRLGAVCVNFDIPAIEVAVSAMRAAWGDIPVQDRTGKCAHLATAKRNLRAHGAA